MLRRWLVVVGMLSVIAVASAWLAYKAKREVEKANADIRGKNVLLEQSNAVIIDRNRAVEKANAEIVEKNEINLKNLHDASMADYAVAVQRIEKDDKWGEGVAHLARALKWESDNPLAAARLYSTLSFYAVENQTWPRKLLRHESSVLNAQFSPDGTRILTVSDDHNVRVWDATTGKTVGEPLRHGWVKSAQFSPDGTRIVTASDDYTARVWEAATGKPVGEPLRHTSWVESAQFSPDGTRIVTASHDQTARVTA